MFEVSGSPVTPEIEKWLSVIPTRAMEDNHSLYVECFDCPTNEARPE